MRAKSWLMAAGGLLLSAPAFAQLPTPSPQLDRYGGETSAPAPARFLDWSGKTQPASATQPAEPISPAGAGSPSRPTAAGGAKYYTIHREYGLAPDAIPIPPRFFGPTADLSQPPAENIVKRPAGPSAAGLLAVQDPAGNAQ